MGFKKPVFLFDAADYELVRAVNEAAAARRPGGGGKPSEFAHALHPRGIRELVEPRAVRMARTMLRLLDTFTAGVPAMEERLEALQALRDEAVEGLDVLLHYNTARALLQVIKDLVRERTDPLQQLRLAHDMRTAMLGNPLFIRRLLRRYHLLEMPETWTPVTFDQHVHDANTKGRKSPTHLIMDAWIKGVVKLQVVYYNYVPREAAEELLRAARIMNMEVRIGVELRSLFRGRFIEMIWAPRGFSGVNDYLKFLDRPKTGEFTRKCRKAANFRRKLVLELLDNFNHDGRGRLNAFYGIDLPPVTKEEFLASVRYGQPSIEHIGEALVIRVRRLLREQLEKLESKTGRSSVEESRLNTLRDHLTALSDELLRDRYVDRSRWDLPPGKPADLPEINRYTPCEQITELHKIASGFRMTLNLSGLRLEDVIEILYDCRGEITTLEIFNLKDEVAGERPDDDLINQLRHALNTASVFQLKNLIRRAIERLANSTRPDKEDRIDKMRRILRDMSGFFAFYSRSPLGASLGSDSASRPSRQVHGMGFVVIDTLPGPVKRSIRHGMLPELKVLDVISSVYRQLNYLPREIHGFWGKIMRWTGLGYTVKVKWNCPDPALEIGHGAGNLAALGGFAPPPERPLARPVNSVGEAWHYLNSNLKIAVKILAGFLAAFLTFHCGSYDWWFLSWFGAVIWLGITAVRNIIQSILAGGGWRSSPLLKWNDYISWQRVADSLFYTGLSVPILDWLVKTVILHRWLGLTAESEPLLVYTGIALANGFYIMGHNLLRAFPKAAVWGNWLRAPLSIPLALLFNFVVGGTLGLLGVPAAAVSVILQQWAAILSKLASDVIGGVIEAHADRGRNITGRLADLRTKLRELFELISKLELLLPEEDLPELMRTHDAFPGLSELKRNNLVKLFYVNALDLMYIWMRQPQAITAMRLIMKRLSPEERLQFVKAQEILKREKSISKMFLSGLAGKDFTRPLAFYLAYYREYLKELREFDPVSDGKDIPEV